MLQMLLPQAPNPRRQHAGTGRHAPVLAQQQHIVEQAEDGVARLHGRGAGHVQGEGMERQSTFKAMHVSLALRTNTHTLEEHTLQIPNGLPGG